MTLEQQKAIAIAQAKARAAAAAASAAPKQQAPSVSIPEDMAAGFSSGLVEGLVSSVTPPAGITLPGMMGLDVLRSGYEASKPYFTYDPKTVQGQYARTFGQYLPSAAAPGSISSRVAGAVIPAVVSETAGQMTKGTAAEPAARLIGGLVGGRLATPRTTEIREIAKLAPTNEQLAKDVTKSYEKFRSTGTVFDKTAFQGRMKQLRSDLIDADFDEAAPVVFKKVDRMLRLPQERITPGLLDKKYSELGDILADAKESETAKKAAGMARKQIMDIVNNSPVKSTTGVTGPELSASIKKARELAAAKFKAEDIQTGVDVGSWYQSGDISGIRNQLSNLGKALEKNKNIGWNKIELEALKRAAKGDFTTNFFNVIGKMGFQFGRDSGQAAILPTGLSAAGTVNPFLLGLVAAGTAARPVAKAMTRKRVEDLKNVIMAGKSGQAAGMSAAEKKNTEALIRQLMLSGQSSLLSGTDEERR